MHKVFAAIRAWHRPRQHHSLFARWWRDFVILLPTWPLMHLFFSGPWDEGIGSLVAPAIVLDQIDDDLLRSLGGGRPPTVSHALLASQHRTHDRNAVHEMRAGGQSWRAIAAHLGVGVGTVRRAYERKPMARELSGLVDAAGAVL